MAEEQRTLPKQRLRRIASLGSLRASEWLRAIDAFVPERIKTQGPDALRRARLAVTIVAAGIFGVAWSATEETILGTPVFPRLAAALIPVIALLPVLLKRTASLGLVGNAIAGLMFAISMGTTALSGGGFVGALVFLPLVPALAVLIAGPRSALVWTALTCVCLLAVSRMAAAGVHFPVQADPAFVAAAKFRVTFVVVVWLAFITLLHESLKDAALADLGQSEARYRALAESSPLGILACDKQGQVLVANRSLKAVLAMSHDEPLANVLADGRLRAAGIADLFQRCLASGRVLSGETELRALDGSTRVIELRLAPLRGGQGRAIYGAEALVEDVTRARRAAEQQAAFEEQIRQAQKLESLGVLTSRIAHDFNNLLTTIGGNTALLLKQIAPGDPRHERVRRIELATHHAGQFIGQLLAYAGERRPHTEPTDLTSLVADMAQLLDTAVPGGVTIDAELAPHLPEVRADLGQMRQVVMNLITNAGEAIGAGQTGTVRIRTRSFEFIGGQLPGSYLRDPLPAGTYAVIEVSDDGCGMDVATLEHIFDPFFTTKANGRGLGLSALLGIVRGHHGALQVESILGAGTTFRVFLPSAAVTTANALEVETAGDPSERTTEVLAAHRARLAS